MKLRNVQADMEIGITISNKQHALYVKEGKEIRILAYFPTRGRAELFMEKLKKWDSLGGGDE